MQQITVLDLSTGNCYIISNPKKLCFDDFCTEFNASDFAKQNSIYLKESQCSWMFTDAPLQIYKDEQATFELN